MNTGKRGRNRYSVPVLALALCLFLSATGFAAPGDITTVAGGSNGDNGPATSAIVMPFGVAVDTAGNIYIADRSNNRIRKVTVSTGVITTVAGNGVAGYGGDNGPATSASLNSPYGVALDASGNIYIADSNNNRIRKVDTLGTITTVAGNGVAGYSGDNGPATSASLNSPYGVALDASGNIYIADSNNNRIRKVDTLGTITTVAGSGTYGYSGDNGPATSAWLGNPSGVALDASGNIYIVDRANNLIRKVLVSTGTITTVAGNGTGGYSGDNGPATSASLLNPFGVALDASGNMYIADSFNCCIRKVNSTTGVITTVAGNGTGGYSGDNGLATAANLNLPFGVTLDASGNIYIADYNNYRIRKVTVSTGVITTVAGNGTGGYSGDNGPATSAMLYNPSGVALDASGNIYIADRSNYRIRKVTVSTGVITTVAGNGTGGYSGDNGPATSASLLNPFGVALDASGNIYIADRGNNRIRKVTVSTGVITTVVGNGVAGYSGDNGPAISASLFGPHNVALDASGNIYIADTFNYRIRKVLVSTGTITTVAGNGAAVFGGDNGPATSASLNSPYGVALDAAGNIYIADYGNNRIRKVTVSTGVITTVAGNGTPGFSGDNGPATSASLSNPFGVALDASGNIYIGHPGNNSIRKVTVSTGVITTVAGNGVAGYGGDNGPATSASLNSPYGVALDASANLYIADLNNNRIRKVQAPADTTPPVTTASATTASGGYTFGAWTPIGTVTVALSATDAGSGVAAGYPKYCIDTANACAPATSYTVPISVMCSVGLLCTQYVRYQSVDNAGNIETVQSSVVKQDLQAPVTTASPGGGGYSTSQTVTLSCSDGAGSGCGSTYYCLGTGCNPTTLYTAPLTIVSSADLVFHSMDLVMNPGPPMTASYVISTLPSAPAGITLTSMRTGGPTVRWTAVSNATSYNIYRSTDNATWTLAGSVASPTVAYTDTSAPKSNTVYYWTVTAVNASGESAKPAAVSGRTALRPGWNMISAPYSTTGQTPTQVFGPWATWVWLWTSTSNTNPDTSGSWQQAAQVKPGQSLFAWSYNNSTVLAGSGAANATAMSVTLLPGWNLIADHLGTNLTNIGASWLVDGTTPLNTAITNNVIGGSVYTWNGNTYDLRGVALDNPAIEAWQGYWILNMTGVNHTLTMQ